MNNSEADAPPYEGSPNRSTFPVLIVAASLAAIVGTFVLASSTLEVAAKTRGFSAIIASFLIACVVLYFWQARATAGTGSISAASELEYQLNSLDEAKEYFAGALNSADTFRLVGSRIKEIAPFRAAVLMVIDPTRSGFIVTESAGAGAAARGVTYGLNEGLAGKCYATRSVEVGTQAIGPGDHIVPSVAIPLTHDGEVFGVLHLFFDVIFNAEQFDASTFEAIGSRVSPLILGSIAFERSRTKALTDSTTDLPNERAFRLILENQVAEATRKRNERPLTILTMDIKGFDDINSRFGHTTGDAALNYVAKTIRDNLRQMDFFARALNDEFLAILPTASKEISPDVIARIRAGFLSSDFLVGRSVSIDIDLNFGWAAFGEDGETAQELLSVARLRKEQHKYPGSTKVLTFSKQLVN